MQIFVLGFHLRPEQVYSIEVFPVPSFLRNLFHKFQQCLLCIYVTKYSYYVKLFPPGNRYCLENTDWLIDRLLDADLFNCQIPRLLQPSPLLFLPFGKYWRQRSAWKHIHQEEVTMLITLEPDLTFKTHFGIYLVKWFRHRSLVAVIKLASKRNSESPKDVKSKV